MNQRFTIDGDDALETRLEALCARARDGVLRCLPARKVRAIILAGGYGRGEGGVLKSTTGDQPYNDLEFYVLIKGSDVLNGRLYNWTLQKLAHELSLSAGIEVEFKLLSIQKLRSSEVTMFYYDLITAHRIIHGDESCLADCGHHRAAHRIPLYEATRLLMNRCSGLLYAQEHLARSRFAEDEADFAGRNLAKAKLAFGDVLLAIRGQYHYSCRERHKRLRKLEVEGALRSFNSILLLHEQGVAFKLHPCRSTRGKADLQSELSFLKDTGRELWLHLESRRLNRTFDEVRAYSLDPVDKCPETKALKNRIINARRFGYSEWSNSRYPRERLLNTLPLLLWDTESITDSKVLSYIQRHLRSDSRDFTGLVKTYESLWRDYN